MKDSDDSEKYKMKAFGANRINGRVVRDAIINNAPNPKNIITNV